MVFAMFAQIVFLLNRHVQERFSFCRPFLSLKSYFIKLVTFSQCTKCTLYLPEWNIIPHYETQKVILRNILYCYYK
jgi:Pyruvate/2-oxoacid:ferredoxin oxidoreductase delta subunit